MNEKMVYAYRMMVERIGVGGETTRTKWRGFSKSQIFKNAVEDGKSKLKG